MRGKSGKPTDQQPTDLDRMLLNALAQSDLAGFKECLSNGANPNMLTEEGLTPLFLTALYCKTEFLSALIAHRADLNQRIAGNTVLMWLGFLGSLPEHERSAELLIKAGADLQAKGSIGTALDAAVEWDRKGIAKLLAKAKAPCNHRHRVAFELWERANSVDASRKPNRS